MGIGTYLLITLITLIVLVLGMVIGYMFGTKRVEEFQQRLASERKPTQSGSVHPMTVKEKESEKEHKDVNKSLQWLK